MNCTDRISGGEEDPCETRHTTLFVYIGSYESAIQDAIAPVPTPISEPSSFLLAIDSSAYTQQQTQLAGFEALLTIDSEPFIVSHLA